MMNCNGCGMKRSWPNYTLPLHLTGGTKENRGNLSPSSRCLDIDLNHGPLEYKAAVLTA
jgi:hypothetical protein